MRIAYSYLMRDDPDRVRAVAPDHAAYWHDLDLPAYLGGPMADRSGGLITFEARSVGEAEQLVASDPFVRADLLESAWVKEWKVERPTQPGTFGRQLPGQLAGDVGGPKGQRGGQKGGGSICGGSSSSHS